MPWATMALFRKGSLLPAMGSPTFFLYTNLPREGGRRHRGWLAPAKGTRHSGVGLLKGGAAPALGDLSRAGDKFYLRVHSLGTQRAATAGMRRLTTKTGQPLESRSQTRRMPHTREVAYDACQLRAPHDVRVNGMLFTSHPP